MPKPKDIIGNELIEGRVYCATYIEMDHTEEAYCRYEGLYKYIGGKFHCVDYPDSEEIVDYNLADEWTLQQ